MSVYEPGKLEVLLTLLAGRLAGSMYKDYVDRLDLKGNERILDFGSGSGNPARYLAARLLPGGGRLTCLDISETWQSVAQRRLQAYPNVDFQVGDICALAIPDASFDVVFIHFVLHGIEAGQRTAVAGELARVLARGGKVYVREPVRRLSQDEVRRLLRQHGLREVSTHLTRIRSQGTVYEGVFRK